MGKNKKKNTSLPKHCVQPKNTSGPQLLERIDPQVICPYCVHGFALSRAKFTDACPICPHCNETILTQDYDRRYKEIKTECPPVIEKADRVLKRRDKLAVAQFRSKFELIKRWYGWRMRRLNEKYAQVFSDGEDARRKLNGAQMFAYSRYYTSAWFALSSKPLERASAGPLKSYCMRSKYSDEGEYALYATGPHDPTARGVRAEWVMFSDLIDALGKSDQLKGARLCPNIYISNPSANEMDHGASGSWSGARYGSIRVNGNLRPLFSQVDCLLLTKWAVYVIEVKSRRAHVRVDAGGHVSSRLQKGDIVSERSLDADVRQCANHANAFATAFPDIPFERIFELTVYVEPLSFASDCLQVADNAYACSCRAGADSFADAIEAIDYRLCDQAPLFTQQELYGLSGHIMKTYGDPNGRKEYIHLERLETLRYLARG